MAGTQGWKLEKLFEVWVSSELKVQIVVFFNDNPGVIETLEGLARRLGISTTALRHEIADHVELGIIKERRLGDKTVLVYDRSKAQEIERYVSEALSRTGSAGEAGVRSG